MIPDDAHLKLAEDVTFQTPGGGEDTVILCLRSGYLYTCNETSSSFLSAIDGQRTFAEIVDRLIEEYDVARDELSADLKALAERLVEEKMLFVDP